MLFRLKNAPINFEFYINKMPQFYLNIIIEICFNNLFMFLQKKFYTKNMFKKFLWSFLKLSYTEN